MPINSINIENFKSIRKSGDIALGQINVLIGQNGAGKSNFISFFEFLNKLYKSKLKMHVAKHGRSESILHFGLQKSQYLSGDIILELPGTKNKYSFTMEPDINGDLIFKKETLLYLDRNFSIGNSIDSKDTIGSHESMLSTFASSYKKYYQEYFSSLSVFHFWDTGFRSSLRQAANSMDYAALHDDGSNIAAFLYRIQEASPKHFNLIVSIIHSIAPFIDRFILKPDEINPNQIFLRWQEKGSEKLFSAAHLSDGTLRIICLTALLLQPDPPPVIIIDEPELGLHPYAISKIAAILQSTAVKSQLIIATQSVNLVNEFSANDIIVVERENQQTVFKRQSEEKLSEWLKEYSLGELWEKNILGSNI